MRLVSKAKALALVCGTLLAPSLALAQVSITVGDATGKPGQDVTVLVVLNKAEADLVLSIETTLGFSPETPIGRRGNLANCTALQDVTLSSFRFQPSGCTGAACTTVLGALLPADNQTGFGAGDLYSCVIAIAADAEPGEYALTVPNASYVTRVDGMNTQLPLPATPGTVTVAVDTPTPVDTPTHTFTPTSPPTPTSAATNTPPPSNTPSRTSTSAPTSTPAFGADDGCQMTRGDGTAGTSLLLILLLPLATLSAARRFRP